MLILFLLQLLSLQLPWSTRAEVTITEILPFVQMDEYTPCVRARGDAYCFVSAKISENYSHPLYSTLVEYSTSPDVTETLESCLNATLDRDYGLSARVFRTVCSEHREGVQLDASDVAFGAVVFVLLVLNLLGSLYDFYGGTGDRNVGKLLLCFAIRRNWSRLARADSTEPEQQRLRGLSFYRVFYALWIIAGHPIFLFFVMIKNTEYLEKSANDIGFQIYINASIIVQVFFVLSALLLAYNLLVAEKHQPFDWKLLHKALFARWLRLTPVYAMVIFFIATWMRHVGDGPFWKMIVEGEATYCRRDWWLHLLYMQNYFDINSRCMLASWYLAVELQLTFVGLAIFFLLKSTKARQAAIGVVVAAGLITPAATTYFYDIDPVLVHSPEVVLNGHDKHPTFNKLYKRGHTNLVCYGLGLALGYVVFYLKESDIGAPKFKKYRVLNWLLFPATLALMLTGARLYFEVPPMHVRVIYASAIKFFYGLLTCLHVFFTIVQVDNLRTKLYNWHGWTILRRLAYCVYLIHMGILSVLAGSRQTTVHASTFFFMKMSALTASASFLLAVPLFLMVESPCAQLAGIWLGRRRNKRAD